MNRLLAILLVIGCSILPALATPDRVPGHILVRGSHAAEMKDADKAAKHLRKLGGEGWELWEVADVDAAIAKLKKRGILAEPDIIMDQQHYVPNDPCVASGAPPCGTNPSNPVGQWNLDNIHAKEAWDVTQGDGAVIGFIGAGPNPSDPEIGPQLWENPGEVAGDGLDNDNDGYVDDTYGIDIFHIPSRGNPTTIYWHDHACAGVAGATTDNSIGIAGVAPHAKLAFVKTAGECGGGASISNFITALDWFQAKGIKTVSVSFGCGPSTVCFSQAVQDRINSYYTFGGLIFASAGNDSHNHAGPTPCVECDLPCDYTNVICTASNNGDDALSSFSDYGPNVELAAPGGICGTLASCAGFSTVGIWTTILYDSYVPTQFFFQNAYGTSFSSPTAAAVGAMIRALHPTWPAGSIRIALQVGGDTIPGLAPPVTQWGKRLNALKSVCFSLTPKPPACP